MYRVRVLGCWWGTPRGDFPVRPLAARLKELRDAEVLNLDGGFLVALPLCEDDVCYGHAVLLCLKDVSAFVMFKDVEDWEAIKRLAEEKGGTKSLVDLLLDVCNKDSGIVELG